MQGRQGPLLVPHREARRAFVWGIPGLEGVTGPEHLLFKRVVVLECVVVVVVVVGCTVGETAWKTQSDGRARVRVCLVCAVRTAEQAVVRSWADRRCANIGASAVWGYGKAEGVCRSHEGSSYVPLFDPDAFLCHVEYQYVDEVVACSFGTTCALLVVGLWSCRAGSQCRSERATSDADRL